MMMMKFQTPEMNWKNVVIEIANEENDLNTKILE